MLNLRNKKKHNLIKYFLRSRLMACSKVFTPVVRREGKWEMAMEEFPENKLRLLNLFYIYC